MAHYKFLADFAVVIHAAYVAFVVFGLLASLLGALFHWKWVRNFWFRTIHFLAIAIVVVEALNSIVCPLTTLEQFRPYLERRAYDIVQPDAGLCGITEAMRIADMAHRYGVDLCPHSWHNGLMAMANAHLVAALPNPRVLELNMIQGPLQWDILAGKPAIKAGWLVLPDRPGLGVDLAENLEARFPYLEGHYAIQVFR